MVYDSSKKSAEKPKRINENPITYDDYAAMPDDGNRYELVDGYLELMSPGPNTVHQLIVNEIFYKIKLSCESEYLILTSPLDVALSKREVRQPDLIAIHRSRLDIVTKRGIEGAPDLVVEILSPSTRKRDKIGKSHTYAKYGIPEYWIVDPDAAALEQYVLAGERYELRDVYQEAEPVRSERISCISFSMDEIMKAVPELS